MFGLLDPSSGGGWEHHKLGRVKPTRSPYLPISSVLPAAKFTFIVLVLPTRVEVYLGTGDRDSIKSLFDSLLVQRASFESELGDALGWDRINEKRACRISFSLENGSWADRTTWDLTIKSSVEAMLRLRSAFESPLDRLARVPTG